MPERFMNFVLCLQKITKQFFMASVIASSSQSRVVIDRFTHGASIFALEPHRHHGKLGQMHSLLK